LGVAEADYQIRVACDARESLGVRTILLRHVNGHAGLVMNGISTRKKKSRKKVLVLANVHAKPADDKSIQEVISRLMIEPGVLAARWEKLPEPGEG
jgi:hypothetical protein